MARSGGPTVGVDVGSHSIKVAECAPSRGGVAVRALGIAPTPAGAMENNVIVDSQLLAQAVKQLLKASNISTKASVSSVSGQSALVVRVIEVPNMSDAELAETMRWEVERHVPFAANEVIMDFQRIARADAPPDAQNMEVLLAVAQQDMIDRHVEMIFAAGLSPVAIDVEPLAVCRTFVDMSPDPRAQKTIAVVNIGANNTDIAIFKDGLLAFPRTLPLAGESLTRAIMSQLGIGPEQAEEYKRVYGEIILDQVAQQAPAAPVSDAFLDFSVPPPADEESADSGRMPFDFSEPGDTEPGNVQPVEGAGSDTQPSSFDVGDATDTGPQFLQEAPPSVLTTDPTPSNVPAPVPSHDPTRVQVFSAIAPVVSELVTEVRRSLEYFRGRAFDAEIHEILLCGGSSKIRNLDRLFETELGIPTRIAPAFQYADVATKNMSPEVLEELAPTFAVAIGLAARDMVKVQAPVAAGGGRKRGKK
jgi:type IV pilus assembly protein PilM